jgi:glycerophosphoryl diester phosphodiesterase
MGVRDIELDTQLSTDGQVVLCHDSTLERYGHGPRNVEQTSSAELLELDMGAWFSPYLFSDERMIRSRRLSYNTGCMPRASLRRFRTNR